MDKRSDDHLRVKDFTKKNSEFLNKIFYVSDFRKKINQNKAFRDLKPTKVMLISVEKYLQGFEELENRRGKDVYFSENVFLELNSKNEINYKKIVPIFDNTGNRAEKSFALFIFEKEDDAISKYNSLLNEHIESLNEELKVAEEKIKVKIEETKNKVIK